MRVTITAFESSLLGERGKAGVKERLLIGTQPLAEFRSLWYRRLGALQFVPGQVMPIPVKHYDWDVNTKLGNTNNPSQYHFCLLCQMHTICGVFLVKCRAYLVLNLITAIMLQIL